jgi:hypothetical protein
MNKQTLIKLSETHYIIVDDCEIKEKDWYCNNKVLFLSDSKFDEGNNPNQNKNNKLITHSTQSLDGVKHIPLSEVEKAIKDNSSENLN